jgi:hypothetical protein
MSSYSYKTDDEKKSFLEKRIQRLEATLERLETLGMSSISSAGQSKSFRNQEEIRMELERAYKEYEIINARINNDPINPTFKEMVVCDRKHY